MAEQDPILAALEAEMKELFRKENSIAGPWMDKMRKEKGYQRGPRKGELPEWDAVVEQINQNMAKIEARKQELKNRTMNLSAPNESKFLYGDDWVPPPAEDVKHFGPVGPEDAPAPGRPAPLLGSRTKSGAEVVSVGDFVKDFIEDPMGMNLGFGEGARVTAYSPTDPSLPIEAKGRYAFRVTKDIGSLHGVPYPQAIDDFVQQGLIRGLSDSYGPNATEFANRSFWNYGKLDPFYLGQRGKVFVMDTERARYNPNRTIVEPEFPEWKLANPSYTTFEAAIPENATPFQRALWAANPMNRTGLAVYDLKKTDVQIPVGEPEKFFVLKGMEGKRPHMDIEGKLTVPLPENYTAGGMNEHGQLISKTQGLQWSSGAGGVGVDVDNPVYDRVTPFWDRPLSTHMANARVEAQIARNTIPALAREGAVATNRVIARNPGMTIGAAGFLSDIVFERAENMRRYPDPISGWTQATGEAAMNLIDPTYYMGGIIGPLEAVSGIQPRRAPTALPLSANSINLFLYGRKPDESQTQTDPNKPFGINFEGRSMKSW